MYSSDRSNLPPKITLKMQNYERYESLFRNKDLDNNCFRPLNPPPFSLMKVQGADSASVLDTISVPTSNIVTPRPAVLVQVIPKEEVPKQDTHDAALLLASIKNSIQQELCPATASTKISLPRIPDLEKHFARPLKLTNIAPAPAQTSTLTITQGNLPDYLRTSRIRAVSMDSHLSHVVSREESSVDDIQSVLKQNVLPKEEGRACISPSVSPLLCPVPLVAVAVPCAQIVTTLTKSPRRAADRRKRYLDAHDHNRDEPKLESHEEKALKPKIKKVKVNKPRQANKCTPKEVKKGTKTRTVLRKKFSWKNYPELENFLIANREEYLRHSALNYTMQQKQYNNRLTERLVDLATECGYVFDSKVFTFVSIRDRIRCYFKSYVQSRKKRGVIIGYAARKAGLLTEKELERNAKTKKKK